MSRITMLAQAATIAFLLSTATATAYQSGGSRRLWLASGIYLAVLEMLIVWSWTSTPSEGPLWLTTLGVIPPILCVSKLIESLGRRQTALPVQILAGTVIGLFAYVVTAFIAYVVLVTLS